MRTIAKTEKLSKIKMKPNPTPSGNFNHNRWP